MNKTEFIKRLQEEMNDSQEKCVLINDILENHWIIGRKNKYKIKRDWMEKLNITEEEAENIYDTVMKIIMCEVKNKIKHPFN